MRFISVVVLWTATVLVAGCATQPKIPFDRSALEVKSIGIVSPKHPNEPSVYLASSVGRSFGLIGALVDAGMQANRESQFKTLLSEQKTSAPDTFVASLAKALEGHGYIVKHVPATRAGGDFLEKYPQASDTEVDAYLDLVTTGYGYIAAGIGSSTPWRPFFYTRARLVSAKDASVIMQDVVAYNPITPYVQGAVTVPPAPEYAFENFDGLIAEAPKAAKGLDSAAEQLAGTVAGLLR